MLMSQGHGANWVILIWVACAAPSRPCGSLWSGLPHKVIFDGQGPHWVGPVPCWPWESWLCPSPVLVSKTGPYYLGTGELWLCFLPALEELVSHSTEELILMVGSSEKPMDYGVMGELALQGYWPQIHPLAAGQHKGASVGELALPLTWRGRELTEARADQLSYHPGGLHSALCIGPLQYNSTHNLLEPLKEPILQNHNSKIYKRSFDDCPVLMM